MTPDPDLEALAAAWSERDFDRTNQLLAHLQFRNMIRRVHDDRTEAAILTARLGRSEAGNQTRGDGDPSVSEESR